MLKFLRKSFLFLLPLALLGIYSVTQFPKEQGDLLRIGYLPADKNYRDQFIDEFKRPIYYLNISSLDSSSIHDGSILVIGDSFSKQDSYGYKNNLAEQFIGKVFFFDYPLAPNNPIESLIMLNNGDFFQKFSFDYVILQSVERAFVLRADSIDKNQTLLFSDIRGNEANNINEDFEMNSFPGREMIKLPLFSVLYSFSDNAFLSSTYRFYANVPLFSGRRKDQVLVYEDDIKYTPNNNDPKAVAKLNDILNQLAQGLEEKGVKLVVLPGGDKFDIYYDYIIGSENYPKPLFFDIIRGLEKEYIFIDSKKVLSEGIDKIPDVYFADDTHWSPIGSKIIADELERVIQEDKLKSNQQIHN